VASTKVSGKLAKAVAARTSPPPFVEGAAATRKDHDKAGKSAGHAEGKPVAASKTAPKKK
jgi:hypothetical protein